MTRAAHVSTLALLLCAACTKKDSPGEDPPPAKAAIEAPSLDETNLVEPALVEAAFDSAWARELAPLPSPLADAKPLATVALPEALRARAEARLPELIGGCDGDDARWTAAQGARLYLAAACWEGGSARVAVLAVDGERIAPVGIDSFEGDEPLAVDIAGREGGPDGAAAVCLSRGAWSACFAVDEPTLADRATRGPVATRLASCPDAVAAIAGCQTDDAFVQAIADGSPVGADPDAVRAAIATAAQAPAAICAEWIEQPAAYNARRWTVPLDDFAALTAAAAGGCTALATAVVDGGGLPYRIAD